MMYCKSLIRSTAAITLTGKRERKNEAVSKVA